MSVKRWSIADHGQEGVLWENSEYGEYVLHADHLAAVEEAEKRTRSRTLAECKAAVEALVIPQAEGGVRSNTGFRILAIFDKGGPLDPGSEGE